MLGGCCVFENQFLYFALNAPISSFRQLVHNYATVYDNQVYSILEIVAVLDQSLVISLIPAMTEALRNSEYKQGLGRNTVQRYVWGSLLLLDDEPQKFAISSQQGIVKLQHTFLSGSFFFYLELTST